MEFSFATVAGILELLQRDIPVLGDFTELMLLLKPI
jgi:hypothetical protein